MLMGKSYSEGYYYFRKVRSLVERLTETNKYKFIFCFSSQIAKYALYSKKDIIRIMDFCDVDSDKFLQYSKMKSFPLNLIYKWESKRLAEHDNRISLLFNSSIFITPVEAKIFRTLSGDKTKSKIYVIGNGVDFNYFKPIETEKENSLVFTGEMNYYANVDGVQWFCEEVFPEIVKKIPDIKFYIVGRNPTKIVRKLASNNVIVTGAVNDVRPYIAKAKMAVIPLRIARGVQNKILEAMAMAIPVVIPENLFSTLDNISKDDVFVYKNREALVNIIIESINNNSLLKSRGMGHRKYVMDNLNWDTIFEKSTIWADL
jgi:sugar transferase (PEP-CTERM/EpsH1 system associated)